MRHFIAMGSVGLALYLQSVFGHITAAWTAASSIQVGASQLLITELTAVVANAWALPLVVLAFVVVALLYLLSIPRPASAVAMGLLAFVLMVHYVAPFTGRRLNELSRALAVVKIPAPVEPELNEKGEWVGMRGDGVLGKAFKVWPSYPSAGPAGLRVAEQQAEFLLFAVALATAIALLATPRSPVLTAEDHADAAHANDSAKGEL